jgi:hypothetical protein
MLEAISYVTRQDYWINVVNNTFVLRRQRETVANNFQVKFLITYFSLVHVVTGWCFAFIKPSRNVKIINAR